MRLTLQYATTLLLVLLGVGLLLRVAVRTELAREFDESVGNSAQLVRQFFRVEIAEYQTIEATLAHMAGELVFEDRMIHVLQPDGKEYGVVGRPNARVDHVVPPPVRRVLRPLDPALAPGWTIEVIASSARLQAVDRQLDRWMLLGIPGLVVLAAGMGWWLTGRALQPVGRMAQAASRITPGGTERLPIANPLDELGQLGERFNAVLGRLDGALAQQQRFLADAAHELRTPLARLRGRLEVAAQQASHRPAMPAEQGTDTLPAIAEDVERMARLVDELLQLARTDAAPVEVLRQPLFLDDLVTDELQRWQPDAARAGISLTAEVHEEVPVHGDPQLLLRLLGVLLDNAIRYSLSGGTVTVAARRAGDAAALVVTDDGIGIPPEETALVTDRFFRGRLARSHRADGSGLGLAIASWIVQVHGGRIAFVPGPDDRGTQVTVDLPLRVS